MCNLFQILWNVNQNAVGLRYTVSGKAFYLKNKNREVHTPSFKRLPSKLSKNQIDAQVIHFKPYHISRAISSAPIPSLS